MGMGAFPFLKTADPDLLQRIAAVGVYMDGVLFKRTDHGLTSVCSCLIAQGIVRMEIRRIPSADQVSIGIQARFGMRMRPECAVQYTGRLCIFHGIIRT